MEPREQTEGTPPADEAPGRSPRTPRTRAGGSLLDDRGTPATAGRWDGSTRRRWPPRTGSLRPPVGVVAGVVLGVVLWAAVVLAGLLLVRWHADTAVETRLDRDVDGGSGAPWHHLAHVVAIVLQPVAGVIVIAALGAVLLVAVGRSRAWGFVVVTAVPWLSTEVVKVAVDRARPDLGAGFHTAPPDSGSFPSGHTALAVALALGIGWLFVGRRRVLVTVVGLVLAGVVGVSRLVLGVHYPTDVLASFVATTAVFLVVSSLLALTPWRRRGRRRRQER